MGGVLLVFRFKIVSMVVVWVALWAMSAAFFRSVGTSLRDFAASPVAGAALICSVSAPITRTKTSTIADSQIVAYFNMGCLLCNRINTLLLQVGIGLELGNCCGCCALGIRETAHIEVERRGNLGESFCKAKCKQMQGNPACRLFLRCGSFMGCKQRDCQSQVVDRIARRQCGIYFQVRVLVIHFGVEQQQADFAVRRPTHG